MSKKKPAARSQFNVQFNDEDMAKKFAVMLESARKCLEQDVETATDIRVRVSNPSLLLAVFSHFVINYKSISSQP